MTNRFLDNIPEDNWEEFTSNTDVNAKTQGHKVLLWCNYDPTNAATICDHVNAIVNNSNSRIFVYPKISPMPETVDFDSFDVIIVHYSLAVGLDAYISQKDRDRLAKTKARKCLFIQDEYRFVNRTRKAVLELGISAIFTCLDDETAQIVYGPEICERVVFSRVLTGYISEWLLIEQAKPIAARALDVGYRGRSYSAWLGDSAHEKVRIGREFLKDAKRHSLKCNIKWGEKDRIYGRAWTDFQKDCRCVLSSETALGEIDFDGTLSAKIEAFEGLARRKTWNNEYKRLPYDKVRAKFFSEGPAPSKAPQLSPRTIEAACLRTGLIMYEGGYSGFFEPWVHYLPLKKDHSNMDLIVKVLKSDFQLSEIIANSFALVSSNERLNPKYMVKALDSWIESEPSSQDSVTSFVDDTSAFNKLHGFSMVANPHAMSGNRTLWHRVLDII